MDDSVEIAALEKQSAVKAWWALTVEERGFLLDLLEHGESWLRMIDIDDPNGPISQLGELELNMFGLPKRDRHGHPIHKVTRRYRREYAWDDWHQRMLDWKLVTTGQASGNWGMSGGPPVAKLTERGRMVARYGSARTLCDLVEKAAEAK